ncbi:hypothetical protein DSL92_04050 [Billgrantia gudaonensis]|uniref:Uncharacterized protein n=1 Tax=Billgrantia gudaonensis TaxID=376427 RepID=A0A432JJK9_9GAMM|nr:hypothetical protein DSL92_04050 [Halomonas gudaonensis]
MPIATSVTGRLFAESEPPSVPCRPPRRARVRQAMARRAGGAGCSPTRPTSLPDRYHTFEVSVYTALVVTADRLVLQVPSIETGPAVVTATVVDEIVGYRWRASRR